MKSMDFANDKIFTTYSGFCPLLNRGVPAVLPTSPLASSWQHARNDMSFGAWQAISARDLGRHWNGVPRCLCVLTRWIPGLVLPSSCRIRSRWRTSRRVLRLGLTHPPRKLSARSMSVVALPWLKLTRLNFRKFAGSPWVNALVKIYRHTDGFMLKFAWLLVLASFSY